ncbi:MAG TPA: ester cyclase [Allosphingosinicella sp.]|nr:ester cyclase [Allosphingosinicella sp.]
MIAQWAKRWSDHDAAAIAELFVDDFVYEDVPSQRVNRSAADLRAFTEEVFTASSDVRYEISSAFVSGDRGCAEWVMRGTHTGAVGVTSATGKRFEVKGSSIFEFKEEKIRHCSDYWCIATLLAQIGTH